MGFDDLLMDIDRIWSEMEPFYTNIPVIICKSLWYKYLKNRYELTCFISRLLQSYQLGPSTMEMVLLAHFA